MPPTRYIDRPRKSSESPTYAAQYERDDLLDTLREVAQKLDDTAEVVEVPQLGVLIVRYLRVPDDHPAHIDYVIVPEGYYLAYSESYHLLYESDPETFAREHQVAT